MKKKTLLDSIDVPLPCEKSWDEMTGDEVSRFCTHCEKDIYNISAMTRKEAKKLLFQSKEKVCIRLEKEPDGRIKTLRKQVKISYNVRQKHFSFLSPKVTHRGLMLSPASQVELNKSKTVKDCDNISI